jgi:hypothetical protein
MIVPVDANRNPIYLAFPNALLHVQSGVLGFYTKADNACNL